MYAEKRWINVVLGVCIYFLLVAFDLPDEKKFITRKVENITVKKSDGTQTKLLDVASDKPVILSPVYTRCPMACSMISSGVKKSIDKLGTMGKDFTVVTFSFDPSDETEDLQGFEKRWKMDGINWKTVNADSAQTAALLRSIDYHYDYDIKTNEYAHPNVVVVITPNGRISRYIYGVEPKPKDLKIAVLEAQVEKTTVNNFFQTLYIRCFQFDPQTKSYHLDWGFLIQTSAGFLMIGIIGTVLIRSFYFNSKEEKIAV